jgi:hypothetical protein
VLSKGLLPVLILGLTGLLTAAAIDFLTENFFFQIVAYSTPENMKILLLKNGELELSSCEQGASQVASAIRASCPACKVMERCIRGLDAERRKILSQEPLSTPSLRQQGGKLTMTLATEDPQLALGVCRQTEQQTASQSVDQRLRCFPALAPR